MDIARYSIDKPVNIWLMVVILLLGGVLAMSKIGRLEDPAFTTAGKGIPTILELVPKR